MRPLILLALALTLTSADLEQITLKDGRRLIGYYDEAAGTLTLDGQKNAAIRVPVATVVSRSPYIRAEEKDPAKRDAQALVALQAERAAALAEAERMRKFAASRSGPEMESARSQAAAQDSQADTLRDRIAAIEARQPVTAPETKTDVPRRVTRSVTADRFAEADRAIEAAEAKMNDAFSHGISLEPEAGKSDADRMKRASDAVSSAKRAREDLNIQALDSIAPGAAAVINKQREREAEIAKLKALSDEDARRIVEKVATLKPSAFKLSDDPTKSEMGKAERSREYNSMLEACEKARRATSCASEWQRITSQRGVALLLEFGEVR